MSLNNNRKSPQFNFYLNSESFKQKLFFKPKGPLEYDYKKSQ